MLREMTAIASWSYTAPLGTPVVPLVQTMQAGSVAATSGRSARGSAAKAAGSSASARIVPAATPSGSSTPVPTTVTTGSLRSKMLRCSVAPRRTLIAAVIAPALSAPW